MQKVKSECKRIIRKINSNFNELSGNNEYSKYLSFIVSRYYVCNVSMYNPFFKIILKIIFRYSNTLVFFSFQKYRNLLLCIIFYFKF